MPLAINHEVFITCAVTGSGASQDRSPHVPRSPKQIADSAIEAAKAGAAIVHSPVRDPSTGVPGRDRAMFREVTQRTPQTGAAVGLTLPPDMGAAPVPGPQTTGRAPAGEAGPALDIRQLDDPDGHPVALLELGNKLAEQPRAGQ